MRWRISDSLAGLVGRVQAQEVWKTDEVIFNRPGWTQSSAGNLTLHAYTKTHTRSVHLHAHQPLTHLITSARPERRQGGGRGSSGTQWPHCSCSRTHISRLNTHVFSLLGQAESIWDVKRESYSECQIEERLFTALPQHFSNICLLKQNWKNIATIDYVTLQSYSVNKIFLFGMSNITKHRNDFSETYWMEIHICIQTLDHKILCTLVFFDISSQVTKYSHKCCNFTCNGFKINHFNQFNSYYCNHIYC